MLSLTRQAYYARRAEAMSIIWGEGEWSLESNPVVHRYYREFSTEPAPAEPVEEWLWPAARRALLEERPDLVVVPGLSGVYRRLLPLCRGLGIRTLCWPSQPVVRVPEDGPDAVVSIGPGAELPAGVEHLEEAADLWRWLEEPRPAAFRPACGLDPESVLEPHRARLTRILSEEGARLLGPSRIAAGLGERSQGTSDAVLAVFWLGHATDPEGELARLRQGCSRLYLIEPVNLLLEGRWTFRYGDYDNEFAAGRASHDLKECLSRTGPPGSWSVEILGPRSGAAQGSGPPEAPDGSPPLFLVEVRPEPLPRTPWHERFRVPDHPGMNIVLLDSQNIAGSVLNHATAINRHTAHRATALCVSRHPFIEYPPQDCRPIFLESEAHDKARRALEQADCFIFFEDDDETSPAWPFDLSPYLAGRGVVHLYVGYRVHRRVAELQRPGRRIVTPLPHLLRMFPKAHFYAGFPPATLDDLALRPPRSSTDGIVRVLHTPSLPHAHLSRYYYHKDTELFIEAARELSARHAGRAEFWQIGGWPHAQILQARLDCDITFNQLRGYHGLSGDEAMYLERPMVQAFDQSNTNRHREYWGMDVAFPWRKADRDSLSAVLEELILDPGRRLELGRAGRAFMLEYFSPRVGILPLIYHCHQAVVQACREFRSNQR